MFPRHEVPVSGLSHVPRAQGATIKLSHVASLQVSAITPQSSCQATGFQNQASVILPGHSVPPSNLSHDPKPHVSTMKPQSFSQAKGFQNQTSVIFPGHMVTESNLSRVPRTQGSRENLSHVPWTQVSKIKSQSCSKATRFHN